MDFQVFSELPNKSVAKIKILFAGYHCRKGAVSSIFSVLNREKKNKKKKTTYFVSSDGKTEIMSQF